MKESEIQALISLLEDDDPSVLSHVEEKLISLGDPIIPALEAAWESESAGHVQQRIEEVVHRIQTRHTLDAIKDWRKKRNKSLLEGWFLITQYKYPELDFDPIRSKISRLSQLIWLEMRNGMTTKHKLRVINRMLFDKERFRPNRNKRFDPYNYFLNGLIETKRGSPLGLGFLYLILCQELNIPVNGIILPGYFVLHFEDERSEVFIDVYDKGTFFSRKDLSNFLKKKNVESEDKYFRPSSKSTLILTLIEALIFCYKKADEKENLNSFKILLNSYKNI